MKNHLIIVALSLGINGLLMAQSSTRSSHTNDEKNWGGSNNAYYGKGASENSVTGANYNVSLGINAGNSLTTGDNNVYIGESAGFNNEGSGNIFLGRRAGYNETGSNLLYIANSNTSSPLIWGNFSSSSVKINGSFEVTGSLTFPTGSLTSSMVLDGTLTNADISSSAAITVDKLQSTVMVEGENISLLNNNAGYLTSSNLYDGSNNVSIGNGAFASGSGQANIAFGRNAMNGASGDYNITLGYEAFNGSSGDHNIAIGRQTLSSGNTGYNIAIGYQSLRYFDYSGKRNVAIGYQAMLNNVSGGGNTGIGDNALQNNVTGENNTALGYLAGPGPSYSSLTNTVAIGYGASASTSNSVVLGNASTDYYYMYQNTWNNLSDGRFKVDIKENVPGLEFINQLRPVTYKVDLDKLNRNNGTQELFRSSPKLSNEKIGFIAQEVQQVIDRGGYNFHAVNKPLDENGHYTIGYTEFIIPLTKAVQELSATIVEQQATILAMKEELAKLRESKSIDVDKVNKPMQGSKIYQNRPNPFTNATKIDVEISDETQKARLVVFNMQGQELKALEIREKGVSTIEISRAELPKGLYFYALITDGLLVETHKMVIE